MKKLKTYVEVEAQSITTKEENGEIKFLVIYREKRKDYTLPKGHVEEKESIEDAAVRETKEETGYDVEIIEPLGSFEYQVVAEKYANRCYIKRRVYNFLCKVIGGKADGTNTDPHEGHMQIFWWTVQEAMQKLSYENNKEDIKRVYEMLNQETL